MATCKNCLHYEVCKDINGLTKYIGKDVMCNNVEQLCDNFKDKSKIIELPCKVGDKLYDIALGKTAELTVIGINMCWNQNYKHITVHTHNYRSATLSWELKDFGKTIFLTNEEAEKALKELDFNE